MQAKPRKCHDPEDIKIKLLTENYKEGRKVELIFNPYLKNK